MFEDALEHLLGGQLEIFYGLRRSNNSLADLIDLDCLHLFNHALYRLVEGLQGLCLDQ